jgi:outer membrane receptor protein involved in Fe transport
METGLKVFSRWNSFTYNFYDLDTINNVWIINPVFSNDLEHKEYIYSGYLMYSDSLSKKLFYKIGARLEYNTTDLIQKSINEEIYNHYLFPFPYLLLTRNINKAQSLALSINRRVTRPTYMQLNPFINVIDQTTYETGNKNLKPEILDKVEFNYTVIKDKYQFRSNLYYSSTKDFITQVSLLSPPDNLILTYVNGDRLNKIGADLDYVYKFNKVFSVTPAFSVFYTKSSGNYNEIDLSVNNFAWTGNVKTTIRPDQKTDIQILLNYNSPVALPQFNLGEIYYADIAIKRSFMKNKLALSLSLTDVFNTRKWIITSDNTAFRLYNSSKNDTRIFWIGITYNINSFKSKAQNNNGNETDNAIIKLGQ